MLRSDLCEYCSVSRENQLDNLCRFRGPTRIRTQPQGGGFFLVVQAHSALLVAYRSRQDSNAAVAVTSGHTYRKHVAAKSIIKTYFYAFEPCKKVSAKLIGKLTSQGLCLNRSFFQRPLDLILSLRPLYNLVEPISSFHFGYFHLEDCHFEKTPCGTHRRNRGDRQSCPKLRTVAGGALWHFPLAVRDEKLAVCYCS